MDVADFAVASVNWESSGDNAIYEMLCVCVCVHRTLHVGMIFMSIRVFCEICVELAHLRNNFFLKPIFKIRL